MLVGRGSGVSYGARCESGSPGTRLRVLGAGGPPGRGGGRGVVRFSRMNPVSIGEFHGLRVGSALVSIVAGCIIIGVSRDCDADAVGGIFLGAGGLGEYS